MELINHKNAETYAITQRTSSSDFNFSALTLLFRTLFLIAAITLLII
jgi:hypothetical protein